MGVGQSSWSDHLISLTADEAVRAYEAIRHRLPSARPRNGGYKEIETLAEIADQFDVFLLDAFGVLNVGETAIPGAVERVTELTARMVAASKSQMKTRPKAKKLWILTLTLSLRLSRK